MRSPRDASSASDMSDPRRTARSRRPTVAASLAAVSLVATTWGVSTTVNVAGAQAEPDDGFVDLFNGENFDGFYTWTPSQGRDNDTQGVFEVVDGEIRILDIPATDEQQDFGYFATEDDYADYHLRFEYKWGEEKFAPRQELLRDSGVLYHMRGQDKIWPTSLESQVQEGDTGDFFFLSGPLADSEVAPGTNRYEADGDPVTQTRRGPSASEEADTLDGWNTSEVIVRGDSSVHIVNGVVVNRSFNQTVGGDPLTSGKIAFQVEGAEVSYRNIEIKDLGSDTPRVLAYSGTAGFRHASIPDALDAIDELSVEGGFTVDRSEDPAVFNDADLADYDAVVFVSTTGDFLDDEQERAFEQYIRGGGAFVGIHAATDAEYDWEWYGGLSGASFDRHPAIQEATIEVEDGEHPSTEHLGDTWVRTDEWYDFRTNPRADVNVLLSLDESSYSGGGMGADHPIAWFHEFDGGRSWYTGGGHTSAAFDEPDFRQHLLGGITWALGDDEVVGPIDPPEPGVDLDPSNWTFEASSNEAATGLAVDGDITTRWTTGTKQTPGQFLEVDLGSTETFDQIELATDASQPFDGPRGYEVYASDDPTDFGDPIASGIGDALTTIDVDPVTARHVRIVQTGSDAFRWWSVYEFSIRAATVTEPGATLDPSGWTFDTSSRTGEAANAIDDDITSRWSTDTKQAPGQFFEIDFGAPTAFGRIELSLDASQPFDFPRSFEVYAFDDPSEIGTPVASGDGAESTVIDVDPTTSRFVRVVQTGNDTFRYWSIYELDVFAP